MQVLDGELIDFTEETAGIVAAYVSRNTISPNGLAALITSVHTALIALTEEPQAAPVLQPAVPIRKSITPDAIICLEDGQSYKSLKRPLSVRFNLTPQAYREKWGLPADYPMVAPNYSKKRSQLAIAARLGRMSKKNAATKRGLSRSAADCPG